MRAVSLFASLFVIALTACSGAASTPPHGQVALSTPGTTSNGVAPMTITIAIPASSSSAATRAPKYVSSGTKYVSVFFAPVGTGFSSEPSVPAPCGATSCAITVNVPTGMERFQVDLYDGSGNVLSVGEFVFDVLPAVSNNAQFIFRGFISKIALTPANQGQSLTIVPGRATTIPLLVTFYDKSGAQIIGATWNQVLLTLSVASPGLTLSQPFLDGSLLQAGAGGSFPTPIIDLRYDGSPLPPGTNNLTFGTSTLATQATLVAPTFTFAGTPPGVNTTALLGVQLFQQQPNTTYYAFVPSGATAITGVIPSLQLPVSVSAAETQDGSFSLAASGGIGVFQARRVAAAMGATVAPPRHRVFRDAEPPDAPIMHALRARALAPNASRVRRSASSFTPPTTVGQQQAFWVAQFAIENSSTSTYKSVIYTLGAITSHGWIWIDNAFGTNSAPLANAAAIGANFEDAWNEDTADFGSPTYGTTSPLAGAFDYGTCDANGNSDGGAAMFPVSDEPKINVLITDPTVDFGSGLGGYFSSNNYLPQSAVNCNGAGTKSNEAPVIYVGWFGASDELTNFNHEGIAHEFQHLINYVQHAILRDGDGEYSFVNEGLSQLAQDLSQNGLSDQTLSNAQEYLAAPQNYSLTSFSGYQNGTYAADNTGAYGNSYLFVRYLVDRFGIGVLAKLNQSSLGGLSNIQAATGLAPAQILSDYATALAVSNTGTVSGTDRVHSYQSLNLRGENADGPGGAYQTILSGPAAISLQSGTTTTVGPNFPGAFWFFTMGSNQVGTNGTTVKVIDESGVESLAPALGAK